MENFYINLGKVMARNENAMRTVTKLATTNSKSIIMLGIALAALVVVDMSQDKEINNLRKRVRDLENKEKDDLDFLK